MQKAFALLLLIVGTCNAVNLRAVAQAKAKETGELLAENKAASHFFKTWLHDTPKNLPKSKVDAVVSSLQAEVDKLSANVKDIKGMEKKERAAKAGEEKFKSTLKGKDKDMMESMDQWSQRMNKKAEVGAIDVMSKLKNAIHLIKKGALSGDSKEKAKLDDVLKGMTQLAR